MIGSFPPSLLRQQQLCVIRTDFAETETLLRRMADRTREETPKAFAGSASCVYFKMPYVPPCETFKELRSLILRIRENTGLRAHYRGIVAIEVSEWLGHEREDYFTVLLKYLYDHRALWQSVMIVSNCTSSRMQHFLSACARYITPRCIDMCLFTRPEPLETLLISEFLKRERTVQPEAAALLAETFLRGELKNDRSLTLVERVVEELTEDTGDTKQITLRQARLYLTRPYSILTMLAGKPLIERSDLNEKDCVLL